MKQNQKGNALKSNENTPMGLKGRKLSDADFEEIEKIRKELEVSGFFDTIPIRGQPLSFSDLTKARFRVLCYKLKEFRFRKKN